MNEACSDYDDLVGRREELSDQYRHLPPRRTIAVLVGPVVLVKCFPLLKDLLNLL